MGSPSSSETNGIAQTSPSSIGKPTGAQHSKTNQLENEIRSLYATLNAATYQLLRLLAEYDREELWAIGGSKSCAHWLNWSCGISLGAAREKVRVARALEQLPAVADAFRQGKLSYSKPGRSPESVRLTTKPICLVLQSTVVPVTSIEWSDFTVA
ncbi:MAG: 13E12 repeat family protein [Granulosicoccus sp.]|nr:13E12 repeat family protein [Granulosicoccus sp.]